MSATLEKINDLAKRRGFVYQTSEIYGGLANSYDYGPLGTELLRNIRNLWWHEFVSTRIDMVGLDSQIILHPKTWEASGHVESFTDPLIECRECHERFRADQDDWKTHEHQDFTEPKTFNLMFDTTIGPVKEQGETVYLRPETAQGIFSNFKNVLDSNRVQLPFGIAQVGKSFRNEITTGQFVFRTLEFEQAEIEYFFNPNEQNWKELFEKWQDAMWQFVTGTLGVQEKNLSWRRHDDDERSHYSKETYDLEYAYPFGKKELWGLAYRTDYDLKQHEKFSGETLEYTDPKSGEKFVPHVIEPAVGINRIFLMLLADAYHEDTENNRLVLRFKPSLAPYKVAVFPLLKNKPELVKKAREIFDTLSPEMTTYWDDRGNIGKRYLYQDEMGTPFCVTVDFDTLDDESVTVRDRDTTKQERVKIEELVDFLRTKL